MTQAEKTAISGPVRCRWKTGDRPCLLPPTAVGRCAWHHHWGRLVDSGSVGDGQEREFYLWWEQFQPTGIYAENPGPWWADAALLWQSLIGLAEPVRMTDELARELFTRRCEVRRYCSGMPMGEAPWPRVHGWPLPAWEQDEWIRKAEIK